jgi:hypothetical protein
MVRTFVRIVVHPCLILAALLLSNSSSAFGQAANPFFAPQVVPGNGQMVSADVNGDGKTDLIFGDGTVLLGKGDGTFTVGPTWQAVGSNPIPIAVADFNGDGKVDLLFGQLNTLAVMLGNGDGTFQVPITTSIASTPTSFIVGDLNGDSKPDVLAHVGTAFLTYTGKGDGTFNAGITSNAIAALAPDSFADFNGDSKLDLFVVGQGVQLGNGDGTFQTLLPLPSGVLTGSDVLGDYDGDGKLDIAATGGTALVPQLQVLFGNGDGTFRAGSAHDLPAGTALNSLVAVDLNGDGKADLLGSTSPTSGAVQPLINTANGSGSFTPGTFYNAPAGVSGSGASNIVVADFNGDGKKDVAAFNTILLGNGDGTLKANVALPTAAGNGVTGDFNGDGHPDLALITPGATNNSVNLNIWLSDGKGNFTDASVIPINIPTPGATVAGVVSISAAADFNGDGITDLAGYIWDASGLSVITLLGNGTGQFLNPVASRVNNTANNNGVAFLSLGDLNGDKNQDVLINAEEQGGLNGGILSVMLGNGDGTFAAPTMPFVSTTQGSITLGDFNNDKKLDAIVGSTSGIAVALGNGDGTFKPTTFITNAACQNSCGNLLNGDFNGDGNLDLIVPTGTGYQVLTGKGDGTFTALAAATDSLNSFTVTQVADFNGDGHLDVLGQFVTQSATSLGLILGNGDGTFAAPLTYAVPGTPLVGDFNGDSKPDVALTGATQLVLLFNIAPAVTPPAPPDFSLGSGSGSGTATVTAGTPASFPLSLAGSGGFTGTVALTCSVSPAGPACSVSPSSVTVTGSTAATATVSVTTTARSAILPIGGFNDRDSSRRFVWMFGALLAAAGIFSFLASTQIRPRRFSWSLATACGALLLISATLMSGCGGSNSSGSTGSTTTGTAAGNYTVTVTAQSGSVSHNTQLTLTVQ